MNFKQIKVSKIKMINLKGPNICEQKIFFTILHNGNRFSILNVTWQYDGILITPFPKQAHANSRPQNFLGPLCRAGPRIQGRPQMVGLTLYMVSLRQEQNPIMKFAVPFLKMFTLCMLWSAQFLSDFYSVFCVHQILSFGPL